MRERLAGHSYYLRVSITEACAFRCPYCLPETPQVAPRAGSWLSADEIGRAVSALAQRGTNRVRLTGGEPLLRPDFLEVVRTIAAVPGIREVALTTNGERLADHAQALADAGLSRINVHLDTLRPDRFVEITRRRTLHRVLEGIEAAQRAGLEPVKINTVLMRGVNDDELVDFCRFATTYGVVVRFIELMDTGPARQFVEEHFISAAEARERLARSFAVEKRFSDRGASPAEEFLIDGGAAVIGFIASESQPFCDTCNRLRLTADGLLKTCLYQADGLAIRHLLSRDSEPALGELLDAAIGDKRSHHEGLTQLAPDRFSMSRIGG